MAYEKQTWVDGEIITKAKLDHIEEGIEKIELTPGPKGEPGKQGTAGENGLGWLLGTNIPNSEGRDGDLYLKIDNFDDTVFNGRVVGADAIDITDDVMAELTNEQMQNNNGK